MKKNQIARIALAILAASFLGSSLFAQSRTATAVERIQREYRAFNEAIQCARKEGISKCTPAQKKRIAAVAAVLAAAAIGTAYAGRRLTQPKLIPGLQEYINQVRANLYSPGLQSVVYFLPQLDGYSTQVKTNSTKALENLLKEITSVALPKSLPINEYYKGLANTYNTNFPDKLRTEFGISNVKKLYEFLGTTPDKGKAMSLGSVQQLINSKGQSFKQAGKNGMVDSLVRQLGYMFGSAAKKAEYDAFLGGKAELNRFRGRLPEGQTDRLMKKVQEITQIITALS